MKIIEAFYGLELLLEVARAKAGPSNSARNFKGHREKPTTVRELQNSVVTTCSSPCSRGSCEYGNAWDYLTNYEYGFGYPHIFQHFHFNLIEDTMYTISVRRDPSQCVMSIYDGGLVGPGIFDDGTNPGPFLPPSSSESLTDDCPEHHEGFDGFTNTYTIPTGGGGVYELRIDSDSASSIWVPELKPACPREGFKYSIEISPPPIGIVSADPTCDEPPEKVLLYETGTYYSPPGAFRIDPNLSGIVEYNLVTVNHVGYSKVEPVGDFEIDFVDESINLSFQSYPPDGSTEAFEWLFINDEEGCARFQGFGEMHYNGGPPEPVQFGVYLHDNPDKDAKDTLEMYIMEFGDKNSIPSVEPIYVLGPGLNIEVSDNFSFYINLSDAGNNGRPSGAFPLGECQSDCDKDKDCRGNLVCFTRDSTNNNDPIPGCWGTPKDDYDYCVKRPSDNYLQIPKLGICQGDCDSDLDCDLGLVCYTREEFNPVPCCDGKGTRGKDYCIPVVCA